MGGTATFAINGAAGMIANSCPSMLQVHCRRTHHGDTQHNI
jgi:hypothetical protein